MSPSNDRFPPCLKQEEIDNADNNTSNPHQLQRCHQTQSLSQFRSRFVINPTPIPSDHQRHFANALRTSGTVWERTSHATPDLVSRLQPWQPGATVRRPPTRSTPTKEVRQVIPLEASRERLKKLRDEIGTLMMEEMKVKKEYTTPSIDTNEPRPLYEPMRVDPSLLPSPPQEKSNYGEMKSETQEPLDGLLEYLEISSEKNSTPILPPSPRIIPSCSDLSILRQSTPHPRQPPSYSQATQYYQSLTPPRFPFQGPPQMPKADRVLNPRDRHWEPNMPGDQARRDEWRRLHRHDGYRAR